MTENRAQLSNGCEPIAIVGIGCRFPGADDPAGFWSLLLNGKDAIGDIPTDRFPVETLYDPRPARPGRISTRRGGFLKQLDQFDAQFFGIAPREATQLDPQQRLLLEVSWEAFEDAGIPASSLVGSRTGVFVGVWLSDFEARLARAPKVIDVHSSTGSGRHAVSGRISFALGLEGPSLTVDSGCSSSLAAVHLACQSLRLKESTLAVAGGANIILEPFITMAYSQGRMMALDGHCKFGDARADGYVRSEGVGVVVLKLLSQALADGDPIHALIRGSSVNSNGRSSGFMTRPAQHGHEQMLRQAYQVAGVSPADVSYVEAHGTGTVAGDPVELKALGAVLGEGRPADRPCFVGSVKTNIGHTEASAGIAGLIKVALALRHGVIPASLHLQELNPLVPWHELPLRIATTSHAWPETFGPRVAGVSSFGISGTNAHAVLEAPPLAATRSRSATVSRPRILVFSARSDKSLDALVESYRALFNNPASESTLDDLCGWAAMRRDHHPRRVAVVASSREELVRNLDAAALGEAHPLVARSRQPAYTEPRVAFIFPGQGGQWLGMGRQLFEDEPAFRARIEECELAIREHGAFSVIDELYADAERSRLDRIEVVQPVIFAIQVAMAALWRSWGIEPAAVVGHSMGEVAAAAVAGALSIADAARVICLRSALMSRLSGVGAMGVVGLSQAETADALRGYDNVCIAAINSPHSTVISGDAGAVEELFATLAARDVFVRRVKVDVASHSPYMDGIAKDLLAGLEGIQPQKTTVPMYSTVKGGWIDGSGCDPLYWMQNLRQPVLFLSALESLFAEGFGASLEISPHPVLESSLTEATRGLNRDIAVVVSTRRDQDERASMLAALGSLYANGCSPKWERISPVGTAVSLPSYPWDREHFWPDQQPEINNERRAQECVESSLHPGTFIWPTETIERGQKDGGDLLHGVLRSARELAGTAPFEISSYEVFASAGTVAVQFQRTAVRMSEHCWTLQIAERRDETWIPICRAELKVVDAATGMVRQIADDETIEFVVDASDAIDGVLNVLAAESHWWLGAECRIGRIRCMTFGSDGLAAKGSCRPQLTRDGVEADLEIMTEDGTPVAWFRGVLMQPGDPAAAAEACIHELTWQPVSSDLLSLSGPNSDGAILVISASNPVAGALVDDLRRRRADVVHVTVADRFESMEEGAYRGPFESWGDLDRVAQHWNASGGPAIGKVVYVAGQRDNEPGDRAVTRNSDSTLQLGYVVQWLTHTGRSGLAPLWVVTSGVWPQERCARHETGCIDGPIWGLARTIVRAHPELTCASLDTQFNADEVEISTLADLIMGPGRSIELALHGDRAFTPRFVTTSGDNGAMFATIRDDATYLVTGGIGGVGLEIAEWIVRKGARHLVLLARRSPGMEERSRISLMEAAGAGVTIASADVTQIDELACILDEIDGTGKPLAGVFHAAGILDDAPGRWDREQLNSVLSAKADGAWHLHQLTRERTLDFFVLCSSIITSLAQPGNGAYAAANSFLDSLAVYRQSMGLPAISVEWGLWAGTGGANRQSALRVVRTWLNEGVCVLTPRIALHTLERLGQIGSGCAIITPIDKSRFVAGEYRGLFSHFSEDAPKATQTATNPSGPEGLKAATPEERPVLIRRKLREELAQVLRMDVTRIDAQRPLGTVGLDSLLAVEFARRISSELGVRLAVTAIFSFPTLATLEMEILRKFEAPPPLQPEAVSSPLGQLSLPDESQKIKDMSEEDAVLELMGQRGLAQ